jgi:hypothetical protein
MNGLGIGQVLKFAALANEVYDTPGVDNYSALQVESSPGVWTASDITPAATEKVVAGTRTIS